MKIKPEHLSKLQNMLADTPEIKHATIQEKYQEAGISHMQYRWDRLWMLKRDNHEKRDQLMSQLYQYANDDHIDTALRHILGATYPNGDK